MMTYESNFTLNIENIIKIFLLAENQYFKNFAFLTCTMLYVFLIFHKSKEAKHIDRTIGSEQVFERLEEKKNE